jgi:hypothetical protein
MCYPEKCPQCGKTGWAGCGQHVDDVTRSVPPAERCTCERDSALKSSSRVTIWPFRRS